MKGDKMAITKADPYQDPAYQPPSREPHPVKTWATEQPTLAPEMLVGIKDEDPDYINSFFRDQGDNLYESTHAQAEADAQQAGQKQAEKRERENSR